MTRLAPGRTRANTTITVHSYLPAVFDQPESGPALRRIRIEESFSGDITAACVNEFLQADNGDGTADFTGLARVTGTVADREGTFVLQESGTVDDGIVSGTWFVLPGSGTGRLDGLRGQGSFRAKLGESGHAHLDHWFESA